MVPLPPDTRPSLPPLGPPAPPPPPRAGGGGGGGRLDVGAPRPLARRQGRTRPTRAGRRRRSPAPPARPRPRLKDVSNWANGKATTSSRSVAPRAVRRRRAAAPTRRCRASVTSILFPPRAPPPLSRGSESGGGGRRGGFGVRPSSHPRPPRVRPGSEVISVPCHGPLPPPPRGSCTGAGPVPAGLSPTGPVASPGAPSTQPPRRAHPRTRGFKGPSPLARAAHPWAPTSADLSPLSPRTAPPRPRDTGGSRLPGVGPFPTGGLGCRDHPPGRGSLGLPGPTPSPWTATAAPPPLSRPVHERRGTSPSASGGWGGQALP